MERTGVHTVATRTALSLLAGAAFALAAPASAASAPDLEPGTVREVSRAVPGELIVRYAVGTKPARRSALRERAGTRATAPIPLARTQLLRVPPRRTQRALKRLRRSPAVAFAERNRLLTVSAVPNDPGFPQLWGLHNAGQTVNGQTGTAGADIDAPEAWELTTGGPTVTVAVVDSGVRTEHPDLAPNIWTNWDESATPNGIDDDGNGFVDDRHGWDFADDDAVPDDVNGHGTHVAGTIGARGDNGAGITGVAWRPLIMPVRVGDLTGSASLADMAAGFTYAAENGAQVVNVSMSGPGESPTLAAAVAAAPGVLFVVAAGNEASDNDDQPVTPCNITAPNLICVAASDQNDGLASFSSFGATSVDLAAPGRTVLSTYSRTPFAYSTGFESTIASWTTGVLAGAPAANKWARTQEWSSVGNWSLADSPGGDYDPAITFARTPAINLAGNTGCAITYDARLDINADAPPSDGSSGDYVIVQASPNGTTWTTIDAYYGLGEFTFGSMLPMLDGSGSASIRFIVRADEDEITDDGIHLDQLGVDCATSSYVYLNGTSMATPHVAGIAALALAHAPHASVGQLRAALLGGVDPRPALAGKTVTGGRANALATLELIGARTGPVPENVEAPTLTGSGRAGSMLTCNAGEWTRTGRYWFEWLVDGEPAANGSTNPKRFRTSASLAGSEVTCRVRRSNRNGISDPALSSGVAVHAQGAPENVVPPTLTGTGKAGTMLTCNRGQWTSTGSYSYEWLLDGAPVETGVGPGQTGSTNRTRFRASEDAIGSSVRCRVRRNGPAGISAPADSPAVTITAG